MASIDFLSLLVFKATLNLTVDIIRHTDLALTIGEKESNHL